MDYARVIAVPRDYRHYFRRDYGRLIHSPAFRRLQGKMQLFSGLESDFFRNRLTHSVEVAQIAKSLSIFLNQQEAMPPGWEINLDLVEIAGLAHDIGHPPFGHTGERVLNGLMADKGGFEGNAQTLRVLARLAKKLENNAGEDGQLEEGRLVLHKDGKEVAVGLNLCARSLAAVLKYDQELNCKGKEKAKGYYRSEADLVKAIKRNVIGRSDCPMKSIECQIMDIADDIAYSTYDIEDAFKVELLSPLSLLFPPLDVQKRVCTKVGEDMGREITWTIDLFPVVRKVFSAMFPEADLNQALEAGVEVMSYEDAVGLSHIGSRNWLEAGEIRTQLTSRLVDYAIRDVTIEPDEECPPLSKVVMLDESKMRVSALKNLTYELLVNTSRMRVVEHRGEQIVSKLFEVLGEPKTQNYRLMPRDYTYWYEQAPEAAKPRVIADFIAGMTDRYAIEFYGRLTSKDFRSMFQPL